MKKLSRAVTDESRKRRDDPGNPDICNVYTLHKYFSTDSERDRINKELMLIIVSTHAELVEMVKIL